MRFKATSRGSKIPLAVKNSRINETTCNGPPFENIAADRQHCGEKRKERQEQAGRNREGKHMHFGLHQVAKSGQQGANEFFQFAITRRPAILQRWDKTRAMASL